MLAHNDNEKHELWDEAIHLFKFSTPATSYYNAPALLDRMRSFQVTKSLLDENFILNVMICLRIQYSLANTEAKERRDAFVVI